MPSDYIRLLRRMRDESVIREESFAARYRYVPDETALRFARRWRQALSAEPLDWNELASIRKGALECQMRADISFYSFIGDIERDYVALRRAELELGGTLNL